MEAKPDAERGDKRPGYKNVLTPLDAIDEKLVKINFAFFLLFSFCCLCAKAIRKPLILIETHAYTRGRASPHRSYSLTRSPCCSWRRTDFHFGPISLTFVRGFPPHPNPRGRGYLKWYDGGGRNTPEVREQRIIR